MVKLVKMIIFFNQYLSFFVRIGLALGHYNPVYSVSSGIYKKKEKKLWTLFTLKMATKSIKINKETEYA